MFDLRQHIAVTNRAEKNLAHYIVPKTNAAVDRLFDRQIMRRVRKEALGQHDGDVQKARASMTATMTKEMVEEATYEWRRRLAGRNFATEPRQDSPFRKEKES